MATFKVIAGDFGQGKTGQVLVGALYRASGQGFQMPMEGQSFKTEHIGTGQIEALVLATEENLKKMSGSIGWGLVGGLAAGPIGALAGVLAGGRKTEVTFICKFKDGRKFLGSCDTKTYTAIQAASFAITSPSSGRSAKIITSYSPTAPLRESCAEGRHYACGAKECSCSCHQETSAKARRRVIRKVLGIGGLSIALVMILFLIVSPHKKTVSASDPDLDQRAVQLAGHLLVDDIKHGLVGDDSILGQTSEKNLLDWTKLDQKTSARAYENAYDENEIAADNTFKDKRILISGTVEGVDKDLMGDGYITLRGSGLMGIHAMLSQRGAAGAASFNRGQTVHLVCNGGGRVLTIANADKCEPLDDYIDSLYPTIEATVTSFLSGKAPLHHQEAEIVTLAYTVGRLLPPSSACLKQQWDSCQQEMKTMLQDKNQADSIQNMAKQMMATLKVD